jgi:hypothetical protein
MTNGLYFQLDERRGSGQHELEVGYNMPRKQDQGSARAPRANANSEPLVVLGMHRSGSSALTGILGLCGVWLGEDRELIGANPENPKGFWERRDVRTVCDGLLHAAGADWWMVANFEPSAIPPAALDQEARAFRQTVAELNSHGTWAIKEPRLCLLFPVLRSFIRDPVCIHIYRNPLEVARSLQLRNGFGIAEGIALWEAYVIGALRSSVGLPQVCVSYEELVARPAEAVGALIEKLNALGIAGLVLPTNEAVKNFISSDLHRQRGGSSETMELLSSAQRELWLGLQNGEAFLAGPPSGISNVSRQHLRDLESRQPIVDHFKKNEQKRNAQLATVRAQLATVRAQLATRNAQLATVRARLVTKKAQFRALKTKLATLHASFSWRITKPIRALSGGRT